LMDIQIALGWGGGLVDPMRRRPLVRLLASIALVFVTVDADAGSEGSCPANAGGNCNAKGAVQNNSACEQRGFDPRQLTCTTCRTLEQRLEEAGEGSNAASKTLVGECMGCCRPPPKQDQWSSARLLCDAGIQEQDTDVHDFIKRKAPLFPNLEVEYMEGSKPALELEMLDEPDRILRVEVGGWASDYIKEFLSARLEKREEAGQDDDSKPATVASGAFSAEIQSCSG